MTEPEFSFLGLQQSEAILLQGLITRAWRGKSNLEQDERLSEIQHRFSTPDLDRRWNGIFAEEREIFAVIHREFPQEKWVNLKDIYRNFRNDFSQYEIAVATFEQESKTAEEIASRLRAIEAERIAEVQADAELSLIHI